MRRFIQIVLITLLLAGCGVGWYLYRKGFTKPWRELVIEEFRRRGVEMSFGALAVEPFRGLVARDVRIFDSPKKQRTLARVNEMVVEANYANAVRGKPFLDSLTLMDAALDLPLDAKNPTGPAVTIEGLSTRIVLPEDRVVISRLEAVLFGIRVTASGQIVHPNAWKSEPSKPDDGPDLGAISRVLNELRALKFRDHPQLDIRFAGDLAVPDTIMVEASLSTGRINRGRYQLDALDVALSWRNEALLLHRFEARDSVGRLHVGGSYRPSTRELDGRIRSGMDIAALLGAIDVWDSGELRFESTPQIDAVVKAKFEKPGVPRARRDGDGKMELSGRLRLGRFAFGKIGFDQLAADFAWDGKRWAARDVLLAHRGGGSIRGDAMQDFDAKGNGDFRLAIKSTLNPNSLAPFFDGNKPWQRDIAAQLARFRFADAPSIEIKAQGVEPVLEGMAATGRVKCGHFEAGDIPFDQLTADFDWGGKRWAVKDVVLKHRGGGEIRGDASQDFDSQGKGDFRLAVTSTINPESLAPFFRGNQQWQRDAAARLALFKFPDAPKLSINARGTAPGLETMSASGDLTLGRASYRGVDVKNASANIRFSGSTLHIDNLEVQRTEGPGACSLTFDFAQDLVYVKNARMGVFPQDVATWIDPDLVEDIRPYRFPKYPPNLRIEGVVDRKKGGKRTKLDVKLDAERGLEYTFIGKDLKFDKAEAKLAFNDDRLKITDLRAVLFDGVVKASADISIAKARPGHAAEIRFIDVDFEKLTKLYFDYNDSKGKLNGVYNFNGKGENGRLMKGEGKLDVTEGNVFAIPFLGPFSDVLNKIVPGLGYQRARRAELSFAIADGVITTQNLEIEGKGFSMFGQGKIWFLDDRMDFDMRLNAQGLPGVLLFAVSELLEYRSESKFSEPNWRLKVIPKIKPSEAPTPKVLKPAPTR